MIPFIDLGSQYARIQNDVETAVLKVLRSGQYILGPEVDELEKLLAEYVGVRHAVTCASGTDALLMMLMVKDIRAGDAILTTPFTFFATAEVIALLGATPVFVDIDLSTFNMNPEALERAILAIEQGNPSSHVLPRGVSAGRPLKPRGIIPVDLFGLPADYDRINDVARRHGLFVLEDAAQGFGGVYRGRCAGSLAEVAATSFFPAKPLGAFGDGGALFTDDAELDRTFRSIRVHGQGKDRYENVRLGLTGRLDSIQAAVLISKLGIFPKELEERQRVANRYSSAIQSAGISITVPSVPADYTSAWAQYSVLARDSAHRDSLMKALKAGGVPTAIYYTKPLHLQTAFSGLQYRADDFPVSEDASRRVFSLPMHPYLKDATIDRIVDIMRSA